MSWSSEYNFYEFMSHLIDTLKAVADYKHKLKYKYRKINAVNKVSDSEDASYK